MAGHMITDYFQQQNYEVHYTSRNPSDNRSIILDVWDLEALDTVIESIKPDIIINCVGLLNDDASKNREASFYINSIFPHLLAKKADQYRSKLIHISTDCVFSGDRGGYKENDRPDGTSAYAITKALGEVKSEKHLTIRTSIIGPELKENGIGLFLWFMKQKGTIKGYKNVMWNGVTTLELAIAIEEMIKNKVSGLYHLVSPSKISKYDLLKLIQNIFYKNDVTIIPDHEIVLDRTLINTRKDFSYFVPSYEKMITNLKAWMDRP